MRRVVVTSGFVPEVRTVDVPDPAYGEVLVRMTAAGVCGSDVHAVHGRHPFIPIPYSPGHEVTGTVHQLGDGVDGPHVGQRVVVEPTLPCWRCKQCRAGRENLCESLQFFGCGHAQGGMADYFSLPANRLHVLPDHLDDRQAVLVEPLATPVHAVRLAGPLQGRSVAVLGAGTIGLMVLATARHLGAGQVVVTDVREDKRERAVALGASAVVDPRLDDAADAVRSALGESADVVFDCVAVQETVSAGIDMVRKAGTLVVVGVPAAEVTVPLPLVQDQQVRIQGSATYLPEDFRDSIDMLAAGVVRPVDLITGEYALADAAEAFSAAGAGAHVKVVLTP